MEAKKPDNVVFNEKEQRYDAALKPYATDLGAPVITAADNSGWKLANIKEVNENFQARFEDIHKQFEKLSEQYQRNQLVYNAKFNFQPQLGKIYHLYRDARLQPFLSIIGPKECNFDFVGSYRINADKLWEELQHTEDLKKTENS